MSNSHRIVVDTNILFMSWYNPLGKCADVLRKAKAGKIELFAPDTVKEEIIRVLGKNKLPKEDIADFLEDLPITWINKEKYIDAMEKTKVKHKPDKPIEALATVLGCEILSADNHFKERADLNKLLEEIK